MTSSVGTPNFPMTHADLEFELSYDARWPWSLTSTSRFDWLAIYIEWNRYHTKGKKTNVLIPFTIWQDIVENLELENDLDDDSKAQIIADSKQSLIDVVEGNTLPIEKLWEDDKD